MKLIKKMLAIMFAFMMVVGMGTKVNAEEGAQPGTKGSITITNAKKGESYSIYKILNLDSYSYEANDPETNDPGNGNYSYSLAGDPWDNFIKDSGYFTITDSKYVTLNSNVNIADLAKDAIAYAKNPVNKVSATQSATLTQDGDQTFKDLDLGYYLVDSTVGTLCGLDTTNPTVKIQEKNGTPTVEKKVSNTANGNYSEHNSANIGDTVYFQTSITAQAGAQNYVLHDKMEAGLTFDAKSVSVNLKKNGQETTLTNNNENYVLKTFDLDETCTFRIEFTKALCDSLSAGDQIIVSYSATLNEKAVVGNTGNKNDTWLKYGNSTETTHSKTTTYTFEIPVFKFAKKNNFEKGLAGAKFTLYSDVSCVDANALKFTLNNQKYRYDATKGSEILKSLENTGRVDIEGIKAGTYYLKEIEAPKGYNKLASAIKVKIDSNGSIYLNDSTDVNAGDVKVENKTGTLLPSTGGMGTTIIYMAGAILVIASGIVLVSKKKSKAK